MTASPDGGRPDGTTTASRRSSLREVASVFLRLGFVAFGGPAAHIALMRREAVERRRWLDDRRFLDLLAASNLLPGPTSTELAMLLGHARAGRAGLVVAGILFIAPAAVLVGLLAWGYATYGSTPQLGSLLYGVQPVVLAVVVDALFGLARTGLRRPAAIVVAAAAAVAFLAGVNPVLALLLAGSALLVLRSTPVFRGTGSPFLALPGRPGAALDAAAAAATFGDLAVMFLTFLKIGALVYGSGYVLIAFLRADLVEGLGWITDRQLLDAVAVGQVTPGPVFTTMTFIGFLVAGVPGAVVATVAVFLPAFVLAALAHPVVPRLRGSPLAGAFLDGVTAASLGLMAAVTLQLARVAIVDPLTAALGALALVLLLRFRVDPLWLIVAGALAGVGYAALAG